MIIVPGMIASVLVPQLTALKQGHASSGVTYNDVVPLLLQQLLPNGFLGVALAGLLAASMAGMAANVSSLNTVFTCRIWQDWIRPGRPDRYYLNVGRAITVIGTVLAIGTAFIAARFSNIQDYIQTLFSFFKVPLFAVFLLGLLWRRMTGPAGWSGLLAGIVGAVVVFVLNTAEVLNFSGQGSSFVGGGIGFALAIIVAVIVSYRTEPKPDSEPVGLVRGLAEGADVLPADPEWYRSPKLLAGFVLLLTLGGYVLFILV